MKHKKFMSGIFVLLLLFYISIVYAEETTTKTACDISFEKEGFSCTDGKYQDLIKTNYDCKTGKVCNSNYCCGQSLNSYCCKKKENTKEIDDANSLCKQKFGSEDYSCVKGVKDTLIKIKNYECKPAGSCDEKNCCGDSADVFCCKPSSCENKFGKEGFSCIQGNKKDLTEIKNYACRDAGECDGKNCCGDAKNLFCCRSPEKASELSRGAFDFLSIIGVKEAIDKYQRLSIPLGSPEGTSYSDLQERTLSINIKIQSFYAEAAGYKQLAELRREYIGLPISVIVEKEEGKIVKQEAPLETTSVLTSTIPETISTSTASEVSTADKIVGKTKAVDKTISREFVIDKPWSSDIQLIHLGSWGTSFGSGWGWCKGTFSCKDYKPITENSPSKEEIKEDNYLMDFQSLYGITYEEGVNFLLSKFINISINENTELEVAIKDDKGYEKKLKIDLIESRKYPGQRIAHIKIGDADIGDVALGTYVGGSDINKRYKIQINDGFYADALDKLKKEGTFFK